MWPVLGDSPRCPPTQSCAAGGIPSRASAQPTALPCLPSTNSISAKKLQKPPRHRSQQLAHPLGANIPLPPCWGARGSHRVLLWASGTPPTPSVLPPGWGDRPAPPAWHLQASPSWGMPRCWLFLLTQSNKVKHDERESEPPLQRPSGHHCQAPHLRAALGWQPQHLRAPDACCLPKNPTQVSFPLRPRRCGASPGERGVPVPQGGGRGSAPGHGHPVAAGLARGLCLPAGVLGEGRAARRRWA